MEVIAFASTHPGLFFKLQPWSLVFWSKTLNQWCKGFLQTIAEKHRSHFRANAIFSSNYFCEPSLHTKINKWFLWLTVCFYCHLLEPPQQQRSYFTWLIHSFEFMIHRHDKPFRRNESWCERKVEQGLILHDRSQICYLKNHTQKPTHIRYWP